MTVAAISTITPKTMKKNPPALAANTGRIGTPTTLPSVRPGPANWVCLLTTISTRCTPSAATSSAGPSRMWTEYRRPTMSLPGNSPPKTRYEIQVPTIGMPLTRPSMIRRPLPESRSSGSEYPVKPSSMASTKSVKPTTQLSSRGLRNAPVKKMRSMCRPIDATNSSAAQWWICRISRPPRMSKLMFSVEFIAADISMPLSGTYDPS